MKPRARAALRCCGELKRRANDGAISLLLANALSLASSVNTGDSADKLSIFSRQIGSGAGQPRARVPVTTRSTTKAGVCGDEAHRRDKCGFWSSAAFGSRMIKKKKGAAQHV